MSTRKQLFTSEFERCLLALNNSICHYFKTGKEYNLFPDLFKVFSLVWTSAGVRLSFPRRSSAVRVFSLDSQYLTFKVEPVSSVDETVDDSDLPF